MNSSPTRKEAEGAKDTTLRAAQVLKDFRDAEDRITQIHTKLDAARSRRSDRNKHSFESTITPITMVSTRPEKTVEWKSSWSYSDPREVSGSFVQAESNQRLAKTVERGMFLQELDSVKKAEEEKHKKMQQNESDRKKQAEEKRRREENILNNVMEKRRLENQHLDQNLNNMMSRSSAKLEEELNKRLDKIGSFSDLERKKLGSVMEKFNSTDEERNRKNEEEFKRNSKKREAHEFRQKCVEQREQMLADKHNKELQFRQKWEEMQEQDRVKRQEFLRKKLEHVDFNNSNRSNKLSELQNQINSKRQNRLQTQRSILDAEKATWNSKTESWGQKDRQRSEKLASMKNSMDNHKSELTATQRAAIKFKAQELELELKAAHTNKLNSS
mmetsp:Transcript_23236/g.32127  ORF Transcript_23236/g.32127 Transcript_23236/m.32127 type:complete len:386 (-) Transcript_23236:133-1290(-)